MRRVAFDGYSLLEVVFVLAVVATMSGMVVPNYIAALDEYRVKGAARELSLRLHRARMEAIKRSTEVALQFADTGTGVAVGAFLDGNGNGVRTVDIQRGMDRVLVSPERLSDRHPGVDFGTLPGLPGIDGGAPPGSNPIRVGSSNLLSFSPMGTCSSGTLYIRGRSAQYAIRVFGETGRIRVLKFDTRSNRWNPS
jgi:type II secretory pathway pseudopilin PulG